MVLLFNQYHEVKVKYTTLSYWDIDKTFDKNTQLNSHACIFANT